MSRDCNKPFHKHLMLRGHIENPPTNIQETINWVKTLIDELGMKVLQGPFASYVDVEGNRGLTCVAMIETSHIAFHIWDEHDPALIQLDIYTCGALDVYGTLRYLKTFFDFTSYEYLVYDREHSFNLIEADLHSAD
jgi:S-adenosylmethionine/arginine decarboxylase-like enzyme